MHVVDGDGAEEATGLVGHGDGEQVVAGEHLGDLAVGAVRRDGRVVGDEATEAHARAVRAAVAGRARRR